MGAKDPVAGSRLSATPYPQPVRGPDPDRLHVQREGEVVGQSLAAPLATRTRGGPAAQRRLRRPRELLSGVLRERETRRGTQFQELLDALGVAGRVVLRVGEVVARYARTVLADVADDPGEDIVDRSGGVDHLVQGRR